MGFEDMIIPGEKAKEIQRLTSKLRMLISSIAGV